MQEIINKIVQVNSNLFGTNPIIEKINVGFTNTIYKINDSFIVKICTNNDNEKNFIKEIEFYKANEDNDLIPKLYYSSIDKQDIPYFYEIIEKVNGVSLYNVWHTFSEEQREDVIKQLCEAMKKMHNNASSTYDWIEDIKEQFSSLYTKAIELNIFNEEEQKLLNYGWVDKQGNKHINNLKGFRENYRISPIDEMLETGLGTCIEQAKMIKHFFDKMGIENKLYCHRSYENEENFDKDVRMHCFVLFKYNDNWYHFEHSRTTEEERILVDADGLSHFDSINNLYSLAHNVVELNDEETINLEKF